MAPSDPPKIGDFLDSLDRQRAEEKDELFQSISERRHERERYRTLRREVLEPVVRELERELRQRRHTVKVVSRDESLRVSVVTHGRTPHHGSLTMTRGESGSGELILTYEGVPRTPRPITVSYERVTRDLATRAVLRLIQGLLDS